MCPTSSTFTTAPVNTQEKKATNPVSVETLQMLCAEAEVALDPRAGDLKAEDLLSPFLLISVFKKFYSTYISTLIPRLICKKAKPYLYATRHDLNIDDDLL